MKNCFVIRLIIRMEEERERREVLMFKLKR